ncbi:MAG: hypothetical protein ACOYXM_12310 [Actinomycetota bacterium]
MPRAAERAAGRTDLGLRLRLFLVPLLGGLVLPESPAAVAAAEPYIAPSCDVSSVTFTVDGEPTPLQLMRRGDQVVVTFEVPEGCSNRMTFVSFVAPEPAFDGSKLDDQVQYSRQTRTFGPGWHSMVVDIYDFAHRPDNECAQPAAPAVWGAAPQELRVAVRAKMAESADYREQVAAAVQEKTPEERGATQSGPYDSTCDGSPSQNGNGDGAAVGQPCAGCVGNADDKNPPGQLPGGNDPNAGYECDRNAGVGQSNPAHSGCENFQLDFSYASSIAAPKRALSHEQGLIAAVFCIGTTALCYTTDRTAGDDAESGTEPTSS